MKGRGRNKLYEATKQYAPKQLKYPKTHTFTTTTTITTTTTTTTLYYYYYYYYYYYLQ